MLMLATSRIMLQYEDAFSARQKLAIRGSQSPMLLSIIISPLGGAGGAQKAAAGHSAAAPPLA